MVKVIELIVSAMLCGVTLLSTYFMGKRMLKNAISEVEDLVYSLPQNEEGAKVLYSIGSLIGSGIRSGVGLQKGRGKFSFQDLIGQVIGNWVQGQLPQGPQQGQPKALIGPLQKT